MVDKEPLMGVIMDEATMVTFMEICEQCNIPEDTLTKMVEYGLIEANPNNVQQTKFNYHTIARVQSAQRLHRDLGLNMPGIALVFELMEELDKVRQELDIMHRHVGF